MCFRGLVGVLLKLVSISLIVGSCGNPNDPKDEASKSIKIQPINHAEIISPKGTIAIQHVTLIDGRGGDAFPGYTVIIKDGNWNYSEIVE